MSSRIGLTVPERIEKKLKKTTKETGLSKSEIIRHSLHFYLPKLREKDQIFSENDR
jgi:hypothetical protein